MADVYLTIGQAGPEVIDPLAQMLELRAADPGQKAMREAYWSDVEFPAGARVLEVGCGPGPVTRALAAWPGVGEVIGVDPSPLFVAKARERLLDDHGRAQRRRPAAVLRHGRARRAGPRPPAGAAFAQACA